MQHDIHPDYHPVVFRDRSAGFTVLTRSTATSVETIELDGVTYPVVDVDVSVASHPFWTGRGRVLDTEGRVEKFMRRYAPASAAAAASASAASAASAAAAKRGGA